MTIAAAEFEEFRLKAESSYGVAPGGDFAKIPINTVGFQPVVNTITSQRLRSDRRTSDVIKTSESGNGNLTSEFSYGAFDELLRGLMRDTAWSTDAITNTATAAVASNVMTGTGIDDGLAVGDFVRISGAGSGANRGKIGCISAVSTDEIEFSCVTLANVGSASMTVTRLEYLSAGVNEISFHVERAWTDLAKYIAFPGAEVGTFELTASLESILTCTFGFLSKQAAAISGTSLAGTPTAWPDKPIYSVQTDMLASIGGSPTLLMTDLSLSMSNNLRERKRIYTDTVHSVAAGLISFTGSMSLLFEDETEFNKVRSQTEQDLAFIIDDQSGTDGGNAYVFDLPRVKYTSGSLENSGLNTDVPVQLTFTSLEDSATDSQVRLWRIASA